MSPSGSETGTRGKHGCTAVGMPCSVIKAKPRSDPEFQKGGAIHVLVDPLDDTRGHLYADADVSGRAANRPRFQAT